jgi:outer membrane immunogenic protein
MKTSLLALVTTSSLALGLATSAMAADMPQRMPAKGPAVMYTPPFSWTGFYVGANAGWGWTSGDGSITVAGVPQTFSGDGNGFVGGGQLGYNWQAGNIVYGLETDFQGTAGSGTVTGTTFTGTARTPWFGTIRGRLGYAFDRSMIYVTGGGAYGKSTLEGTDINSGPFWSSATYWTWTAGAGYEAMLWDRWSAKLEYLYFATPSDAPAPNGTTALSGSAHTNLVRAGLNYHF